MSFLLSAEGGGLHPGGLPRGGGSASRGICIQGVCIQGGLHLRGGGVCIQGGLHPVGGGCAWGLGRPPQSDTTGYGQRAGGTHPTGMHSC